MDGNSVFKLYPVMKVLRTYTDDWETHRKMATISKLWRDECLGKTAIYISRHNIACILNEPELNFSHVVFAEDLQDRTNEEKNIFSIFSNMHSGDYSAWGRTGALEGYGVARNERDMAVIPTHTSDTIFRHRIAPNGLVKSRLNENDIRKILNSLTLPLITLKAHFQIPNGDYSTVRDLEVPVESFINFTTLLPNLRRLTLYGVVSNNSNVHDRIIDLIRNSPDLESLHINSYITGSVLWAWRNCRKLKVLKCFGLRKADPVVLSINTSLQAVAFESTYKRHVILSYLPNLKIYKTTHIPDVPRFIANGGARLRRIEIGSVDNGYIQQYSNISAAPIENFYSFAEYEPMKRIRVVENPTPDIPCLDDDRLTRFMVKTEDSKCLLLFSVLLLRNIISDYLHLDLSDEVRIYDIIDHGTPFIDLGRDSTVHDLIEENPFPLVYLGFLNHVFVIHDFVSRSLFVISQDELPYRNQTLSYDLDFLIIGTATMYDTIENAYPVAEICKSGPLYWVRADQVNLGVDADKTGVSRIVFCRRINRSKPILLNIMIERERERLEVQSVPILFSDLHPIDSGYSLHYASAILLSHLANLTGNLVLKEKPWYRELYLSPTSFQFSDEVFSDVDLQEAFDTCGIPTMLDPENYYELSGLQTSEVQKKLPTLFDSEYVIIRMPLKTSVHITNAHTVASIKHAGDHAWAVIGGVKFPCGNHDMRDGKDWVCLLRREDAANKIGVTFYFPRK